VAPIGIAVLPLAVVVSVNLMMSLIVLPRLDFSFLAEARWGATSLSAVAGVWSVVVALAAAILTLVLVNYGRLPTLRESMDAGANASVLPAFSDINPALMHRVAAIGSGTLDSLPHNGAVVTLLAVCGSTHRESYLDIVMVGIVGALIALAAVIVLGSTFGSL
jgi:H+/gluconate symporter-like permease